MAHYPQRGDMRDTLEALQAFNRRFDEIFPDGVAAAMPRMGPMPPSQPPKPHDHPFYRRPAHLRGNASGTCEAGNSGRYL